MADTLSQSDLDALLGLTEDGESGPAVRPPTGQSATWRLSQSNLESILAAPGVPSAESAAGDGHDAGQDQNSDALCQDEIDRLLAEFGK